MRDACDRLSRRAAVLAVLAANAVLLRHAVLLRAHPHVPRVLAVVLPGSAHAISDRITVLGVAAVDVEAVLEARGSAGDLRNWRGRGRGRCRGCGRRRGRGLRRSAGRRRWRRRGRRRGRRRPRPRATAARLLAIQRHVLWVFLALAAASPRRARRVKILASARALAGGGCPAAPQAANRCAGGRR